MLATAVLRKVSSKRSPQALSQRAWGNYFPKWCPNAVLENNFLKFVQMPYQSRFGKILAKIHKSPVFARIAFAVLAKIHKNHKKPVFAELHSQYWPKLTKNLFSPNCTCENTPNGETPQIAHMPKRSLSEDKYLRNLYEPLMHKWYNTY